MSMNHRQQAISMGAIAEPMPLLSELLADLLHTFKADVQFHAGTDNPMYGLFVARTIQELHELGIKLQAEGIRFATITGNMSPTSRSDVVRSLSAGSIDCIIMPVALALAGGFRLPVNRLTIVSFNPLSPAHAMQLLGRAHMEAKVRSLVWLKPEVKHPQFDPAPLYPSMMVTFNDKLTPIQQDSIVGVLIALGCVDKVELGTCIAFDTSEIVTKDAANVVQRALSGQPDDNKL